MGYIIFFKKSVLCIKFNSSLFHVSYYRGPDTERARALLPMCAVATYVKVVSKYCGRIFGCDLEVYFSLMQQKHVNYSFLI